MLESVIEKAFKHYCNVRGVLCLKFSPVGINSYPDRIIIGGGFIFFIEFKAPGKYPEPDQKNTHDRLRKLDCAVYCINEPGQAEKILDTYLSGDIPKCEVGDKGLTIL